MTARRVLIVLPALLLTWGLLAACDGGSGGPDDPAAGVTIGPTSPHSSPSRSESAAGDLENPCDAVDQDKIARLMGLEHVEGDPIGSAGASTQVCSFFDTDHLDAPLLTLQTSATDDYDQFLALSKGDMSDPEDIDVRGADEAAILVDADPDFPGVTLVAHTPGRLQVVTVGDKTVQSARRLGLHAITLLVAGNS